MATGALQNTTFFEASLIDRIPAGIADVRLESIECLELTGPVRSCGARPGHRPDAGAPGRRLDAVRLDDRRRRRRAPSRGALLVTYSGRIADEPVNVAGRAVVNTAHTAWNITNGRTPTAADFAFDRQSVSDTATATVIEPRLSVTKVVDDPTPDPTQRFTTACR